MENSINEIIQEFIEINISSFSSKCFQTPSGDSNLKFDTFYYNLVQIILSFEHDLCYLQ